YHTLQLQAAAHQQNYKFNTTNKLQTCQPAAKSVTSFISAKCSADGVRKPHWDRGKCIPSDVPAGHVAVCVGNNCRRFVVRATYLNHPVFHKLLVQAEEEFGFSNSGPLAIPCDEYLFEEILRFLSRSDSAAGRFVNFEEFQRHCHVGCRNYLDFWPESRPLLQ
ncbi:hypothetical protein R6Q57_029929, partial [Mikania cordata]